MNFSENNKYLYGAYFNTALDNFKDVIRHIYRIIKLIDGVDVKISFGDYDTQYDYLSKKLKDRNATSQKVEELLYGAFPFWGKLMSIISSEWKREENTNYNDISAKCVDGIAIIHKVLEDWRNYTTHGQHEEANINESVLYLLKDMYDVSVKTIIERFSLTNSDVTHLSKRIEKKDKEGKNAKVKYQPAGYYAFLDDSKSITEKGLAFLICLFLKKEEAYHFLKSIKGFKRDDDIHYRMTLEVFTAMRYHAPKRLMRLEQKSGDKVSLAMEMINELAKCPKELYEHLSPEEKKKFEIYEEGEQGEVIGDLIRYKDRYEILMMKALEFSGECQDMGFYMHLSKCYMNCYEKTFIDGTKDNRYITFSLCGFGRLQNSYIKPENISTVVDEEYETSENLSSKKECLSNFGEMLHESSSMRVQHSFSEQEFNNSAINVEVPYISESYPSYIVNDNKIGIKRLQSPSDTILPEFDIANKKVSCPKPDYWLSKYELPSMAFYAYLKEVHKDKLSSFPTIWEIIERDKPQSHASQNSPKKIKELEEERLKKYLSEIEIKISELSNNDVILKNGNIADELARDILWLQPSVNKGKDKLTGANFRTLQYALARYSFVKEQLADIYKKGGLIESKNGNNHPFLADILHNGFESLKDYYKGYLCKKKKFIQTQLLKIEKGKTNINFYPFRKLVNEKDKTQKSSENEPVFLSRNLFAENIKKALCAIRGDLKSNIERMEIETKRVNTAKLIQIYFQSFLKDSSQFFYLTDRKYDELNSEIKDGSKYLSLNMRDKIIKDKKESGQMNDGIKDVLESEKIIRLRSIQDMTLFLWMKEFSNIDFIDKIMLKDIDNAFLSKPISINMFIETIQIKCKVKIKDYGRISSIIVSNSLSRSLIKFISSVYKENNLKRQDKEVLSYNYIFKEINTFVKYRPEIIRLAQSIEEKLLEYSKEEISSEGSYYNFRVVATTALEDMPDIDKEVLIDIRNGFCHNSYPENSICHKEYYQIKRKEDSFGFSAEEGIKEENTIAHYLYEKFRLEQEKIMKLE